MVPYYDLVGDKTLTFGKFVFRVVMYRAYNAGGLIGYEMNGIAVLQEKPTRKVVTDGLCPAGSGYDMPTQSQGVFWTSLDTMSWETFRGMCDRSARSRGPLCTPPANKTDVYKEFAHCFANTPGYDAEAKARWAAAGRRFFNMLRKELGGKVSYNPAGIACSGDFSLRTDNLYVCINTDMSWGYYRAEVPIPGRKGNQKMGTNNPWRPPEDKEAFHALVERMRKVQP